MPLAVAVVQAVTMINVAGVEASAKRTSAAAMSGAAQANAFQVAQELEQQAATAILQAADVVASTCVGIGDARLADRTFDICVVDEASQVTEPDSLVSILKVCVSCLELH